jgi:hypothetical protein
MSATDMPLVKSVVGQSSGCLDMDFTVMLAREENIKIIVITTADPIQPWLGDTL